jgi:arabinose-5-phosphate isomerase
MDYLKLARRVFEVELSEVEATAARLDAKFVTAVDLIKAAVERRNKVVVLGVGKSGNIGEKIAATLTSTGSTAVVLNSLNALHGDLGIVADGDVVLALSYSGETQELLAVLPAIVRFGLPIIAITGDKTSSLARAAQVVLDVSVTQEACPLHIEYDGHAGARRCAGDGTA